MNLLNLFLPIEDKKRLGKFETENLGFKTRVSWSLKQIGSLSTLVLVKPKAGQLKLFSLRDINPRFLDIIQVYQSIPNFSNVFDEIPQNSFEKKVGKYKSDCGLEIR